MKSFINMRSIQKVLLDGQKSWNLALHFQDRLFRTQLATEAQKLGCVRKMLQK